MTQRQKKRKTYKYTIELTEPIYPRHLADYLSMQPLFARQLLSVQDMQRADHLYAENNTKGSDTFTIVPDEAPPMHSDSETSYSWVLGYYAVKRDQAETPAERDAYTWIVTLLKQPWVPGNLERVIQYLHEFVPTLEQFQAYCQMIGEFSEE